ncbi:hypothetical protein Glove_217g275 [Diversispora epigaea]|uniref:TLDc domain-containing protein n=1 Tax=Diversispora epigaea TaxID=1348612 RepID=A0A397IGM3_9GLOM|nr:hypothetical protein Glove_217g275 [Diversispora epigaea]
MKESEIWDYLIKWGTSRNPTLPEKLEEWSDENFMTLKTTVQQCLPLIHYFHVPKHIAKISPWIDSRRISYSLTNNPYELQLILRGSKDGFAPRTFWDICDGHANTIVITKVEGTNEIIGGFNPLAWDKTKREQIKDGSIQNSIISRLKNKDRALCYFIYKDMIGPCFGHEEFVMCSVASNFTQDKKNRCFNSIFYEKSDRTTSGFVPRSLLNYKKKFQFRKSYFKKKTFKFLEKLSRDFSELLNDKEEYNVIIEVYQEQN